MADPSNESLWGIFCGKHSPRNVRDGLSTTVAFNERLAGDGDPSTYTPSTDVARLERFDLMRPNDVMSMCSRVPPGASHFSYSGSTWLIGHYSQTAYNHVLPPNSTIPDCVSATAFSGHSRGDGAHTARSYHPGGVNVCMADGAVRFASENIELKIWRALATIHGGEVVPEF